MWANVWWYPGWWNLRQQGLAKRCLSPTSLSSPGTRDKDANTGFEESCPRQSSEDALWSACRGLHCVGSRTKRQYLYPESPSVQIPDHTSTHLLDPCLGFGIRTRHKAFPRVYSYRWPSQMFLDDDKATAEEIHAMSCSKYCDHAGTGWGRPSLTLHTGSSHTTM